MTDAPEVAEEAVAASAVVVPIAPRKESLIPRYGTDNSAGCDLCADIMDDIVLEPGDRRLIPSGVVVGIPVGFQGEVRSRSGLAYKHGIAVLNSPGTIDSDYRGDVGVILINHGNEAFTIVPGMRIAQLVITWYVKAEFMTQDQFAETERGDGGFGSTGQ